MDIIQNNPYRLLGVYANSSTKERLANVRKIKAFLEVGKSVSFPLDLPALLNEADRTIETANEANAQLALPDNQLHFAQFWFVKATPVDEIALKHLTSDNVENAVTIWEKKDNASSLQNRIAYALISENYSVAITCAEKLYSTYKDEFVALVLGENNTANVNDIEYGFLDELVASVGANKILSYISDDKWKQHVSQKEVESLVNALQAAVNTAKESRGKGPEVRLTAGRKLMNGTVVALTKLRIILSSVDLQYQMIADKVGIEILQCSIDYFNNSKDFDAPKKAMEMQSYALSVVVGNVAKSRCEENVNILKDIISKMPPEEVWEEMKIIDVKMQIFSTEMQKFSAGSQEFSKMSDKIMCSRDLLNNTMQYLQTIKRKLGSDNAFYLRVSTKIIDSALNNLIIEVNAAVKNDPELSAYYVVGAALGVMETMDKFDMEPEFRVKRYNPNRSVLSRISENLLSPLGSTTHDTPTHSYPSESSSGSSGGCYIATMVYGGYDHTNVMVLREFRDKYLATRGWGRSFIRIYYKYSPKLVEKLKDHKTINNAIRKALDRFVNYLKGVGYNNSVDKKLTL